MKRKGRIRDMFGNDRQLFNEYCTRSPGWCIKQGFDIPDDLWNANPEIWFTK